MPPTLDDPYELPPGQYQRLPAGEQYYRPKPPVPFWKKAMRFFGWTFLLLTAVGVGVLLGLWSKFTGRNFWQTLAGTGNAFRVIQNPRSYFPGEPRLNVLCLGLDRNIVTSRDPKINGMPTSKGARSDVIMVASMDLDGKNVRILSIPRDTRVEIPGYSGFRKINEAQAKGGTELSRETVEQLLGITINHHVVIKQDAIREVVNALGGLQVNVEKDMYYKDTWQGLLIDLKEGNQVLNGDQVVGYMRFRHDALGDLGRIKRQQEVIQLLSQKVQDPSVLMKAPGLIQAVRNSLDTDFSPDQQLALAHLFHSISAGNLETVALPIEGTRTIRGISYVIPDLEKTEAVVDWVIRGDPQAMNRLITVQLKNASGSPETYQAIYRYLSAYGFRVLRTGRARGQNDVTHVVQRGTLRGAARRVLETLGVTGTVEKGEGSSPDVTLYVGKDLIGSHAVEMAASFPEPTEEPRRRSTSAETRQARPVEVKVEDLSLPETTPDSTEPGADPPAQSLPETPPTGEGTTSPPPPAPGTAPPPAPGTPPTGGA